MKKSIFEIETIFGCLFKTNKILVGCAIFPSERVADAPFNKYIIKIETVWCQNLSAAHLAHGFSGRDGGASQFHAHCARSRRAIIPDNVKSGEAAFISRRLLSYYLYTAAPGAQGL